MTLSKGERAFLVAVALFGLLGPNGVFVYLAVFRWQDFVVMHNPLALAFITEAFIVMGLIAMYIARRFSGKWGWRTFVALSMIGGLGFSIPLFVVINSQMADGPATAQGRIPPSARFE